jgi:hypothetical protein
MSRKPDAVYEGYGIFIIAVPLDDGRWLATSEVERPAVNGIETWQQFGGPCFGRTDEESRVAVVADTRRKIDDVLARPI